VGVIVKAVTYTIKHEIKELAAKIDLILNEIKSKNYISEDVLFELKVILNELIVNAVCHGNGCNSEKLVYVTFKLINNKYLYISVKDEGFGIKGNFDVKLLDAYADEANKLLCEHGRGLLIVNRLCLKVKFSRNGNKVSVIKSLK
jgi:serine/threonine-protein kinase RsbW